MVIASANTSLKSNWIIYDENQRDCPEMLKAYSILRTVPFY
jgi:hypothetical protein